MRMKDDVVDDSGFVVDPVTGERFPDFLEVRAAHAQINNWQMGSACTNEGGGHGIQHGNA